MSQDLKCRCCGACCTAISISSHIPGQGPKPANVPCIHLKDNLCQLFNSPNRPDVCSRFKPCLDTCGNSREEAMTLIAAMEALTS